jgi:hypothetical protein
MEWAKSHFDAFAWDNKIPFSDLNVRDVLYILSNDSMDYPDFIFEKKSGEIQYASNNECL